MEVESETSSDAGTPCESKTKSVPISPWIKLELGKISPRHPNLLDISKFGKLS
jgi:hypothetical protein